MGLVVERATLDDAAALTEIAIAAFKNDFVLYPGVAFGGPPGHDNVNATRAKIEKEDSYKFLYDGELVGGAVVMKLGEGDYFLEILFIDPARHGLGIGSQVMRQIEAMYPAKRWSLNTPVYAVRNRHFYEKLGYVNIGEERYPEITLVIYEKRME